MVALQYSPRTSLNSSLLSHRCSLTLSLACTEVGEGWISTLIAFLGNLRTSAFLGSASVITFQAIWLRATAYAARNSHIRDLTFCISNLLMIFSSLSSFRVQPLSSRHAYEGWRTLPTDKINLKCLRNDYECHYFCLFAMFLSRYIYIFSLSFVAENYGEYLTTSCYMRSLVGR